METYRASGTQLASRVLAEAQSKRFLGDVIETSPPGLMVLRDSQLLLPYTSPYLSEYPEAAKQKAPRGLVFWTTDRESYIGVGYNKNILPAADIPKNFDDLLKPALKGKMAISNDDVAARLIGGMLKSKGEGFVKKLKEQDVTVHGVSGPGFNELIVSGEVSISFTAIQSNIGHAVDKGAPVAWVPMDLVPADRRRCGCLRSRPTSSRQHCYWSIFFLSPEGQKMLVDTFRHGSPVKDHWIQTLVPRRGFDHFSIRSSHKWQKRLIRPQVILAVRYVPTALASIPADRRGSSLDTTPWIRKKGRPRA